MAISTLTMAIFFALADYKVVPKKDAEAQCIQVQGGTPVYQCPALMDFSSPCPDAPAGTPVCSGLTTLDDRCCGWTGEGHQHDRECPLVGFLVP